MPLLAHEKSGDYDAVTDGPPFADLSTRQLRDVSHDTHLDLIYSKSPLHDRPPGSTPESIARYRKAMEQQNRTFAKIEILPNNIGYLKLNSFPDPSICQPAATALGGHLDPAIRGHPESGQRRMHLPFARSSTNTACRSTPQGCHSLAGARP